MSSTYKDKSGQLFSRVLPQFNGDIITSPRSQVYFLATEYGVINMEGRSTWERAEGLISIAHPDFRDELIKEAEKERYGGVRIRGSRSQRQGIYNEGETGNRRFFQEVWKDFNRN